MKKWTVFTLMILLFLTSCAKSQPAPETQPSPAITAPQATMASEPTEPEWHLGLVRASGAEVLYDALAAGTAVTVTGEWEHYYRVICEDQELLVEQRFLRTEDEAAFEVWTGYARSGVEVFTSAYLNGDALATLGYNARVTVLDGKEDWLRIQWEDVVGYVNHDNISNVPLYSGGTAPAPTPTPDAPADSAPIQDGTDVSVDDLRAEDVPARVCLLGAVSQRQGVILVDGAKAYVVILDRGDAVKVTEQDETGYAIWIDGQFARIDRWLLRTAEDPEYETWSGYSAVTPLYRTWQMENILTELDLNTELEILDHLEEAGCYVVRLQGKIGYLPVDAVGETQFSAQLPTPGGSNGGSTESAAPAQEPASEDVWTPPAM